MTESNQPDWAEEVLKQEKALLSTGDPVIDPVSTTAEVVITEPIAEMIRTGGIIPGHDGACVC